MGPGVVELGAVAVLVEDPAGEVDDEDEDEDEGVEPPAGVAGSSCPQANRATKPATASPTLNVGVKTTPPPAVPEKGLPRRSGPR